MENWTPEAAFWFLGPILGKRCGLHVSAGVYAVLTGNLLFNKSLNFEHSIINYHQEQVIYIWSEKTCSVGEIMNISKAGLIRGWSYTRLIFKVDLKPLQLKRTAVNKCWFKCCIKHFIVHVQSCTRVCASEVMLVSDRKLTWNPWYLEKCPEDGEPDIKRLKFLKCCSTEDLECTLCCRYYSLN